MILLNIYPFNKKMQDWLSSANGEYYCGFFLNKTQEWMQKWIAQQFTSSSSIKSLKKKKDVQAGLELFSTWMEHWVNTKSVQIFLSASELHIFELDNECKNILRKYLEKDEYWSENFDKDYWLDLYYNNDFLNIYEPQKDKLQHYYLTKTKFEKRDRISPENREYLQRFPPLFYVTSNNNCEFIPSIILPQGNNLHHQLIEAHRQFINNQNQKKLEQQWQDMEKTPDLFIFGNEIPKAIKNYQVKEVYCYQKYHDKIVANMDASLLNFQWVIVEDGLDKYNGIFGRKYYVYNIGLPEKLMA